ncbi:MAG TPA: hypothetical protein VK654_12280 [Nitrospirota bacterium]|nr:hypothetical protein [Nitrospirota bacterium]
MRDRIYSVILFFVAVAVLIGILKVLNWVPAAMQEGLPSKYASLEEVKSRLNLHAVYSPSYYPQGLRWPPVLIMAQTKPNLLILQEYTQQNSNSISLIIAQTSGNAALPDLPVKMSKKTEEVPFDLKGRSAMLEVGICKPSGQCSRVTWEEGNFRIMLIMTAPPSEAVKLADSMIAS